MITYGTMGHDEMLRGFGFEGTGGVACIKRDLAALRRNPGDRKRLERIRTWLHTVCGASSFLGLMRLVGITHAGEEVLTALRDGSVSFRPDAGRALTELLDTMEIAFRHLTQGETWEGDPAPLLLRLQSCLPKGVALASGSCGTFRSAGSSRRKGTAPPGPGGVENGALATEEPESEDGNSVGSDGDDSGADRARHGLRLIRSVVSRLRALFSPVEGAPRHRGFGLEWGETTGRV